MDEEGGDLGPNTRLVLLASVFVVAACGLVYELVAGAVSSYLLGDAVTQFSFVIGVFLCAMGIGSYLSRFVKKDLLRTFVVLEIWIGLIGGASSILMFAANVFLAPIFEPFFYLLCASIGVMVGVEIPLLVRILRLGRGFSGALSEVLALDYLGALVGALAFPLFALPWLGVSRASVVFGILNLAVAAAGVYILPRRKKGLGAQVALAAIFLIALTIFSGRMVGFFEDLLYQDSVIYAKDSQYQRIVITRWRNDVRLFIDGNIQFCSLDEARYHEALVIPAMEAAPNPKDVLILGGGDGLAAREVLKYSSVQRITLVDLDPEMTRLGRERPELLALNGDSLSSHKVSIVNTDAMLFLNDTDAFFDVILIDLPDPNNEALAKLYSTAFYALVARRLTPAGVLVTQATSPYFAPEAFWCIVETIEQAVKESEVVSALAVAPYHVTIPSFGEWGFALATRGAFDPASLSPKVPTRFLDKPALGAMFALGKDIQRRPVKINQLNDPVLYQYYKEGWERFFGN